ncbi:hypothetical protein BPAE_0009g00180 [Botrytis paeoniae]|uniref:Uncharacterized protein n=1 Tax=Botrytis paeoniae TaxID=278948 RepID=A0A4Z1G6R0_9HELO|nr:hypothetical protein BPAE_0009g00180 [Botrytis paeoniae]
MNDQYKNTNQHSTDSHAASSARVFWEQCKTIDYANSLVKSHSMDPTEWFKAILGKIIGQDMRRIVSCCGIEIPVASGLVVNIYRDENLKPHHRKRQDRSELPSPNNALV